MNVVAEVEHRIGYDCLCRCNASRQQRQCSRQRQRRLQLLYRCLLQKEENVDLLLLNIFRSC